MRLFPGFLLLAIALATPAAAAERRCAGTNATIYAESVYDTYLACAGAADAVAFMSQQGFTVDTVMHIDILDAVYIHSDDTPALRVLGQYEVDRERISVTSSEGQREMAVDKPIFGIPYEDDIFRSVVAHEVAHAIAEENFHVVEPTRIAHEYIAYIVQLATMPTRLRQRVLDRHPVPAFATELDISPIVYGMNPDIFAVKAYRHFRNPQVGAMFVQTVLSRDLMSIFPQW
ncbi:MAG: hypothetical protein OER92_08145, partial [Alphaproteobacteria bacterium]|nr:hypothetical protein [Alphaproteobacteria bacterium]